MPRNAKTLPLLSGRHSIYRVEVAVETCNRTGCCSSRRFGVTAVRLFDTGINVVGRGNKFFDSHSYNSIPHRSTFTRLSHLFSADKMVNYSVLFHGPLMLGDTISSGSGASSISPLQRLRARIFVDPDRAIEGVRAESLEGIFVYWAPNLENLLLEDSLCTIHGRFIVRGSTAVNSTLEPQWEITSFMCFA
jgi:hypothetical protein